MGTKKWYELGEAANRNRLATIIIWLTFSAIIILAILYYQSSSEADTMKEIFTTLIPLFATWVGTVLAFYFGKENFDIATKRYNKIIDKLNPDVLDDINVTQIMISKQTMVYKNLKEIEGKKIQEIITFLSEVKKSRLPILNEGRIKYVIHKATFLDALNELDGTIPAAGYDLKSFLSNPKYQELASSFLTFDENIILEKIRLALSKNSKIKDVFIIDKNKNLVGWLTDTLILRYLSGGNETVDS
ncbi:hypothetical protein GTQ40_06795 [Flavobacteriaceae bacterium R38]|nr:hypothetical protein [Flavobacteriaceae bacterium R38]